MPLLVELALVPAVHEDDIVDQDAVPVLPAGVCGALGLVVLGGAPEAVASEAERAV